MAKSKKPVNDANNHHFWQPSPVPIPDFRETKHMEFLSNVPPEGVETPNLATFEYPSYFIATDLLDGGFLSREESPGKQGRGANPWLYKITDEGRDLIRLMNLFYNHGKLENNVHDMRPLVRYWTMHNEDRLIQYYINVLMGNGDDASVVEAVNGLHEMSDDIILTGKRQGYPTQRAMYARACLAIYQTIGVVDFGILVDGKSIPDDESEINKMMQIHHTSSETKAGRMSHRYNGMDRQMSDYIKKHLGTDSDRDMMNYVLTVGMFIVRQSIIEGQIKRIGQE